MSLPHALLGSARRHPAHRLRAHQGVRGRSRPVRLAGRAHEHLPGTGPLGRARADRGDARGRPGQPHLRRDGRRPRRAAFVAAHAAPAGSEGAQRAGAADVPPVCPRAQSTPAKLLEPIAESTARDAAVLRRLREEAGPVRLGPRGSVSSRRNTAYASTTRCTTGRSGPSISSTGRITAWPRRARPARRSTRSITARRPECIGERTIPRPGDMPRCRRAGTPASVTIRPATEGATGD